MAAKFKYKIIDWLIDIIIIYAISYTGSLHTTHVAAIWVTIPRQIFTLINTRFTFIVWILSTAVERSDTGPSARRPHTSHQRVHSHFSLPSQ